MKSLGLIFNLARAGLLAVTFLVTGAVSARDVADCDRWLGTSATARARVEDRLGYSPVVVSVASPRRGGQRLELEARGAAGQPLSELSIQIESPERAEVLYSGTVESARRRGLTTLLMDRVMHDHPGLRVIYSTMALENEAAIRDGVRAGIPCDDAVMKTAYAKMLLALGFNHLVGHPDCAANEIEVVLSR